jgi:hypothetical protein
MKSIKGNYIIWSAVHLAFGILFMALNLFWDTNMLVKGHYMYILGISALPALIFIFIFNKGHKPDEREEYLERKVASYSWSAIFIVLMGMYGRMNNFNPTADWIVALVCVALISKGGFGLYFFIRE